MVLLGLILVVVFSFQLLDVSIRYTGLDEEIELSEEIDFEEKDFSQELQLLNSKEITVFEISETLSFITSNLNLFYQKVYAQITIPPPDLVF